MKIMSKEFDRRINSWNLCIETRFGEYLDFAPDIISNNEFQRKRVRTSKSVYSLLKSDLKRGCIMPPLVLAITESNDMVSDKCEEDALCRYIMDVIKKYPNKVLILDGLQRTYTLIDAFEEIKNKGGDVEAFKKHILRLELYMNINKFGVMYRMLTLNTGQTPMSARHQLELLYRDKLDTDVEGIKLITDTQGAANPEENEFVFKNVIDGFNSYMNRNELPVGRQEMLDNIKMLENMAEEDVHKDVFEQYLSVYSKVFKAFCAASDGYVLTEEDREYYNISEIPFGLKVSKVFSTSQAMTGFGAALGKMKDMNIINDISDIGDSIGRLQVDNNDWFLELLVKFDEIKDTAKKIGNAQRMFMQYFFRELFNPESDSYLNLLNAVENGYQKYYSQV